MTDEELKSLVASLAIAQRETDRELKELAQETRRDMKELAQQNAQQSRETDRKLRELAQQTRRDLKELAQQIGGLGNKFGSFTEGMAFPSMQKILTEKFQMDAVTTNYKIKHQNQVVLELDVFAHSNGALNTAFIVEVKSHVREEHIEQLLNQLNLFRTYFPEHANKKLYGILAGVNIPEDVKRQVYREGLYLATISGEHFCLQNPEDFQAKVF